MISPWASSGRPPSAGLGSTSRRRSTRGPRHRGDRPRRAPAAAAGGPGRPGGVPPARRAAPPRVSGVSTSSGTRRESRRSDPPADEHLDDGDILEMVSSGIVPITVVSEGDATAYASVMPGLAMHRELEVAQEGPTRGPCGRTRRSCARRWTASCAATAAGPPSATSSSSVTGRTTAGSGIRPPEADWRATRPSSAPSGRPPPSSISTRCCCWPRATRSRIWIRAERATPAPSA